jgi:hypothetical protein
MMIHVLTDEEFYEDYNEEKVHFVFDFIVRYKPLIDVIISLFLY